MLSQLVLVDTSKNLCPVPDDGVSIPMAENQLKILGPSTAGPKAYLRSSSSWRWHCGTGEPSRPCIGWLEFLEEGDLQTCRSFQPRVERTPGSFYGRRNQICPRSGQLPGHGDGVTDLECNPNTSTHLPADFDFVDHPLLRWISYLERRSTGVEDHDPSTSFALDGEAF